MEDYMKLLLISLVCLIARLNASERVTPDHKRNFQILDELLKKYDRRATPTNHRNEATNVSCELYIRSFGSINPSMMDYQVDLYLLQEWKDERLTHKDFKTSLDLNDPNLVKAIWKPEVFFPNSKTADFQYVTVPNVLVRISPNGDIRYVLRLKLVFSCMMELSRYPLDVQECNMDIGSFSKTTKELNLHWKDEQPIKIHKDLKMPQFNIIDNITDHCHESFQIGNYSCLRASIILVRNIGFHLVQSYLPTVLIVVISWVGFWMDTDSVPARTTLGVTTLLTVSNQAMEPQSKILQVSYIKAIDIWMGICTAFIFFALLEFTVVNYYWRKRVPSDKRNPTTVSESWMELMSNGNEALALAKYQSAADHFTISSDSNEHRNLAIQIDEFSRYIFPATFSLFNIAYWSYYMWNRRY